MPLSTDQTQLDAVALHEARVEFQKTLYKLMADNGIGSKRGFAKFCGIPHQTMCGYLGPDVNKLPTPTFKNLALISKKCNYDLFELFPHLAPLKSDMVRNFGLESEKGKKLNISKLPTEIKNDILDVLEKHGFNF